MREEKNMKKLICLLLVLTMTFGLTAAMATEGETEVAVQQFQGNFDVTCVVPDGYAMQEIRYEDTVYVSFLPDDESKTNYVVSLAYSEEYDGVTLNDMSDED